MSNNNWMPSREQDFVDLCNQWISIFDIENIVTKFSWNEAECDLVYQLISKYLEARAAFKADDSSARRIIRDDARKAAVAAMRRFANIAIRYNDSVDEAVRHALGLRKRDSVVTPVGDPDGIAEAEIIYTGRMQLTVRVKHLEGTAADTRANYGCRIYFGVYAQGDTPPATGKDLRESCFTRLKKELFKFEPEDTGKVAWFCIRYENSRGRAGQWGPLSSAVIP